MPSELPPHLLWWLTLTSPQASFQDAEIDYCLPQLFIDPTLELDGLKRDWGVKNRADLHQQIYSVMVEGSHGHFLVNDYDTFACSSPLEWQSYKQKHTSLKRQAELNLVETTFSTLGRGATRAFDYCRASYLARSGLGVGLVTQEEFDFYHSYLSVYVQHYYHSWLHYTQSFFAGRAYFIYLRNEPTKQRTCEALLNGWIARDSTNYFNDAIKDQKNPIHYCDWNIQSLPRLDVPQSITELMNELNQ